MMLSMTPLTGTSGGSAWDQNGIGVGSVYQWYLYRHLYIIGIGIARVSVSVYNRYGYLHQDLISDSGIEDYIVVSVSVSVYHRYGYRYTIGIGMGIGSGVSSVSVS